MALTKLFGSVLADVQFEGGSLKIPVGTTAERPSSPSNGMLRYNTEENQLEIYRDGVWNFITSSEDNAVKIITGTTAERPSTPIDGMVMYNTDNNQFDIYVNGSWDYMAMGTEVASVVSTVNGVNGDVTITPANIGSFSIVKSIFVMTS